MRIEGATQPTVLNVGSRPTRNVDAPITVMVMRNVYLRPTRSPIRPNTIAPNGRTRKPAAYATNAASSAAVGLPDGKNSVEKNGARTA